MGDKVYTLVISVDLSCCRCRRAIQHYLCQLQRKQCMRILSIVYDEKNNHVLVSGPFDAEQLKRKLLCKFPKIINSIDIREPPKPPKPPQPPQPPQPPDESECIKKCKKECEEKCKKKCEEKCKCKCECECKCKCECECKCKCKCECKCKWECKCECKRECKCECKCKRDCKCECKCECKCKRKCKCKCERDCDCEKKEDPPEPPPKPPERPNPPMCPWPPQVTVVCCARPCPCFKLWSNCYICCSCGAQSWPGMCGPGWGSGPSHGGRPPWGNCESSQPHKIICESPAPPCSIM